MKSLRDDFISPGREREETCRTTPFEACLGLCKFSDRRALETVQMPKKVVQTHGPGLRQNIHGVSAQTDGFCSGGPRSRSKAALDCKQGY